MKRKGFTLVEIMIVVAIIALLAAIAIPNLLRARVNASEAAAQTTLKTMSTACESYAAANAGTYPTITDLMNASPAYLNENYCTGTLQGYNYTCTGMNSTGYNITAQPQGALAGRARNYTIETGGRLFSW